MLNNLRLLCAKHNQLEAEREYGKEFMQKYKIKEAKVKINRIKEPGLYIISFYPALDTPEMRFFGSAKKRSTETAILLNGDIIKMLEGKNIRLICYYKEQRNSLRRSMNERNKQAAPHPMA